MRLDLVQELLQLITAYDRSPFPDGADLQWLPIMDGVDYADARQAIMEHYGSSAARDGRGRVRQVLPHDVRSRAKALQEHRLRVARRALTAGDGVRRGSTDRPAEVEALLSSARLRAAEATARHRAKVAA
jgi:hypothetical protein